MKTSLPRSAVWVRACHAFTLIELLAVMAIILILAGLIINIAGSANYNSAKSRAAAEVQAMSTALENYKTDNGAYPTDSYATEKLDPQVNFDPMGGGTPTYQSSSQFLYQVLSGFPVSVVGATATSTPTKAYISFRPDQLKAINSGATATPTSPLMYIVDPFGFSYGYSTIYAATQLANTNAASANPTGTPTPVTKGYNPTFDLWSTAGYATGGKSLPSPTPSGSPAAVNSNYWVKNW